MRLEAVGFRYSRSGPWVLRDVTAAVEPGDVVVLSGHNGVGKTTLLKICAGVTAPRAGQVADRPAVVGWVPERFPAAQPFTARAYLHHLARVRGLADDGAQRALDHWAQRLHFAPYLDTRLDALSKGSAQKVGLIQALLRPPGLLVLDEPWEGLDAATREQVPAIIAEVRAAGGIVLVSDHRGETARIPGAIGWTIDGGRLHAHDDRPGDPYCVIEIEVAPHAVADTVAALRAAGHGVIGVRSR